MKRTTREFQRKRAGLLVYSGGQFARLISPELAQVPSQTLFAEYANHAGAARYTRQTGKFRKLLPITDRLTSMSDFAGPDVRIRRIQLGAC